MNRFEKFFFKDEDQKRRHSAPSTEAALKLIGWAYVIGLFITMFGRG